MDSVCFPAGPESSAITLLLPHLEQFVCLTIERGHIYIFS